MHARARQRTFATTVAPRTSGPSCPACDHGLLAVGALHARSVCERPGALHALTADVFFNTRCVHPVRLPAARTADGRARGVLAAGTLPSPPPGSARGQTERSPCEPHLGPIHPLAGLCVCARVRAGGVCASGAGVCASGVGACVACGCVREGMWVCAQAKWRPRRMCLRVRVATASGCVRARACVRASHVGVQCITPTHRCCEGRRLQRVPESADFQRMPSSRTVHPMSLPRWPV